MVLGKLPVAGHPTFWITVGQGLNALAVGAGGVCLDIFPLIYPFSSLSSSLWETARYRLKYCIKGLLNPKQPTNQFFILNSAEHDFFLFTNVKMPTSVGTLTFVSRKNSILGFSEPEKCRIS